MQAAVGTSMDTDGAEVAGGAAAEAARVTRLAKAVEAVDIVVSVTDAEPMAMATVEAVAVAGAETTRAPMVVSVRLVGTAVWVWTSRPYVQMLAFGSSMYQLMARAFSMLSAAH